MTEALRPVAITTDGPPSWPGATWVGEVREDDLIPDRLELIHGEGFSRARLLVWSGDEPRGFVEVDVADGVIDVAMVRAEVAMLPPIAPREATTEQPPISVVVCTRDRPEQLAAVLENLTELDYPTFEVIVVDNNPATGLTAPVVEACDGLQIRLIDAPGRGLSIARNAAIRAAAHDIIAFTDDDVVVDPRWLSSLARGFAGDPRVACVCGLVPSATLLTPAQSYFDRRVGWARQCQVAAYDVEAPPQDDALFPMHVALYGTGANFAVRRDVAFDVGGFDEGLGIGSPAAGGEDIDIFVRILLDGYVLVREPSAVVWHHHRESEQDLVVQIDNYGLGLGAWISKLLTHPKTLGMVLHRIVPAIRHLRGVTIVEHDPDRDEPVFDILDGRELKGVRRGPFALLRGRVAGRQAAPLKPRSTRLLRAFDFRRDQMWGEPGNTIAAGRLAVAAVAVSLLGTLGVIRNLPTLVLGIAVAAFMFAGPGALVCSWYARLPAYLLAALVPAVSIAICVLVVTGLLIIGFYNPPVVLAGLAGTTAVGGLLRCAYLANRAARAS